MPGLSTRQRFCDHHAPTHQRNTANAFQQEMKNDDKEGKCTGHWPAKRLCPSRTKITQHLMQHFMQHLMHSYTKLRMMMMRRVTDFAVVCKYIVRHMTQQFNSNHNLSVASTENTLSIPSPSV
jgi:hypothetical protein